MTKNLKNKLLCFYNQKKRYLCNHKRQISVVHLDEVGEESFLTKGEVIKNKMEHLIGILEKENCSLVIRSQGKEQCYWQRGVADLLHLLQEEPEVLRDAQLADKVVGKGAAALMALGGVRQVYARTISQPALNLLQEAGVAVCYQQCVDHIINRAGTDWCPVERFCRDASTPEDCLPLIAAFVASKK